MAEMEPGAGAAVAEEDNFSLKLHKTEGSEGKELRKVWRS